MSTKDWFIVNAKSLFHMKYVCVPLISFNIAALPLSLLPLLQYINVSIVVKRAIFISNKFLNLNVSVHNGPFIRRELPYQIGRQFVQQLILAK